ncbi:MAG: hypothetical protein HYR60_10050 [Acidobacteria bacterium]|nr:hypothetical protein [Acidobacteriota bacterium]
MCRRPRLAVAALAAGPVILRLALLPWIGIPHPRIHDEFSYLLAADTFASGRVSNPPHPLWKFFETMHVIQQAAYASKYPPGQGLALAIGQAGFGHPWFGVLLSYAAMSAAVFWMLLGWLPPRWALAGSLLLLVRYPTYHYWMESYWGGNVAATGGALVLGSLPRILRGGVWPAALAATGFSVLLASRPYEGFALGFPAGIAIAAYARRIPFLDAARRVLIPGAAVLLVTGSALAAYNWRVTGHPLLPPYVVHERTYSITPSFTFQPLRTGIRFNHQVLRRFHESFLGIYYSQRTWSGFAEKLLDLTEIPRLREDLSETLRSGLSLLLAAALPLVWRDRRMRVPLACLGLTLLAMSLELYHSEHYAAPIAGLRALVTVQGLRHLAAARWLNRKWRRRICRGMSATFLVLVLAGTLGYGVAHAAGLRADSGISVDRPRVIKRLQRQPGPHLVIVRYSASHDVHAEWVWNRAVIDQAAIVWARDMGEAENQKLVRYFSGRRVWLLEPDADPVRLTSYQR